MRTRRVPAGADTVAELIVTDRDDGDFHIGGPADDLAALRARSLPGEWSWLRQVHGPDCVLVTEAGEHAGASADAAVTAVLGAVLCVQTADCVPVVAITPGAVGVAHAGWRGLVDGVIGRMIGLVTERGGGPAMAVIGPYIHPGSYAFGADDLRTVEQVVGGPVRATTDDGHPALDLGAATRLRLEQAGVQRIDDLGLDTADERFFSHRVRGDTGRQVTAVRLVPR